MPNTVDARSDWLIEDDREHELADALRVGVTAMRQHARHYRFMLPNPGEMEVVTLGGGLASNAGGTSGAAGSNIGREMTLYEMRIQQSDNPNVWKESILSVARLPFRARIVLDGWDEELMGKTAYADNGDVASHTPGWIDTLTAEGQSLDEYAAEAFQDSLFDGIVFSFVDNDPRQFLDVASRRAARAQPRVTKFTRKNIRRITIGQGPDGAPRLLQVVFDQPIGDLEISDPNAWTDGARPAIKVVSAGDPSSAKGSDARKVRTQVYVQDETAPKRRGGGRAAPTTWTEDVSKRAFIVPDNPTEELLDIPLVPHYANRLSPFRGASPFLETAETQASIWRHNSGLSGLAREASVTHLHLSGVQLDDKKQPILPDTRNMRLLTSSDAAGTATLLETEGKALTSITNLIEWKIKHIQQAHHQIQVEKPTGPVTAREITLEGVQANSALEMWVIFQEKAWRRILDLMALLGGLPKRGGARIPHDFGLPNPGLVRCHGLFLAGLMSPENWWKMSIQAGDVDKKTFDLKGELAWYEKHHGVSKVSPTSNDPSAAGNVLPGLSQTSNLIGS